MAPKNSTSFPSPRPSSPRTMKAAPSSPESSKSLGRSASKSTNLAEKRVDSKQHLTDLQEEVRKAKEDRSRAVKELEEVKKKLSSQDSDRIKSLENEVEKTKLSERKMLESLISQTKQLEQTKILLEEAKLEIRSLQESNRSGNLDKNLENNAFNDVTMLRNELRSAVEAEEKAKKAMDDLAIALKEVTTESNQVKSKLLETQSELEKVKTEVDQSKALLKTTKEKLYIAVEETEKLRSELDESASAWTVKENGFIDCMKASEEIISTIREENDRLIDSQRTAREENYKLRDILKQALNEATVVKEALEIARSENSQLQNSLHEKEQALQKVQQEYDSLKVSEAAATDSLSQLKGMLSNTSDNIGSSKQLNKVLNDDNDGKSLTKVASERVKGENPRVRNARRHSMFDNSQELEREHRMFASVSNISDWRVPSSLVAEHVNVLNSDDFDHIDAQLESMYNVKQKSKRTMLKKFGDMLRRRNSQK